MSAEASISRVFEYFQPPRRRFECCFKEFLSRGKREEIEEDAGKRRKSTRAYSFP